MLVFDTILNSLSDIYWVAPNDTGYYSITCSVEDEYNTLSEKARKHNSKVDAMLDELKETVIKETKKDNIVPSDYPKKFKDRWDEIYKMRSWADSYPFDEATQTCPIRIAKDYGQSVFRPKNEWDREFVAHVSYSKPLVRVYEGQDAVYAAIERYVFEGFFTPGKGRPAGAIGFDDDDPVSGDEGGAAGGLLKKYGSHNACGNRCSRGHSAPLLTRVRTHSTHSSPPPLICRMRAHQPDHHPPQTHRGPHRPPAMS